MMVCNESVTSTLRSCTSIPTFFPIWRSMVPLNYSICWVSCPSNLHREHLTIREWYAYLIRQRSLNLNSLLCGGRLLQHFGVDAYSIIEETGLRYIKENQRSMCSETYKNIRDVTSGFDMRANTIANWIILPASFIHGPWY